MQTPPGRWRRAAPVKEEAPAVNTAATSRAAAPEEKLCRGDHEEKQRDDFSYQSFGVRSVQPALLLVLLREQLSVRMFRPVGRDTCRHVCQVISPVVLLLRVQVPR